MFSAADHAHMTRALELAARGLFTTAPNPRVGCVVVRDGEVVGEGWHRRAGEPHAEVHAVRAAGARARGATVYVSLEPCSHDGRTPPCAEAVVAAGVRRVVAAAEDPNPRVSGGGLARLRAAGIETACGLLDQEARELNIGFVSRHTRGRPWLRVKTAASLDGRTALANGTSQWITSSAARQPVRIVIDRDLELPLSARVLEGGSVLVATAREDAAKSRSIRQAGGEVLVLPDHAGKVDLARLMHELADREMNEILVESGNRLNGALLRAGLVDELVMYFAPHLLGDLARGMYALGELTALDQRVDLQVREVERIGPDLRVVARVGSGGA